MAGEAEIAKYISKMITILCWVCCLYVHIVAGDGTGYFAVSIERKVTKILAGLLADSMTEIYAMTLLADFIEIQTKLPLRGTKSEPAVQSLL